MSIASIVIIVCFAAQTAFFFYQRSRIQKLREENADWERANSLNMKSIELLREENRKLFMKDPNLCEVCRSPVVKA